MEIRPGEVLELGDVAVLYVVKLPGGKKDIIVQNMVENAVEFGFIHYDGNRFWFSDEEDIDAIMHGLLTGSVKKTDDVVYYRETESWALYYFKGADVVFAVGDDDVYPLGSIHDAVAAAEDIGGELPTVVSEFLESIH